MKVQPYAFLTLEVPMTERDLYINTLVEELVNLPPDILNDILLRIKVVLESPLFHEDTEA